MACHDMVATNWLSYFAVAEELETLVLHWINSDVPKEVAVTLSTKADVYVWRNTLFRSLLVAILDHTTDGVADQALRLFFDMLQSR